MEDVSQAQHDWVWGRVVYDARQMDEEQYVAFLETIGNIVGKIVPYGSVQRVLTTMNLTQDQVDQINAAAELLRRP